VAEPYIATLDEDGWCIDDGEKAHRASPENYYIPPQDQRENLRTGSLVKIRFYIRAPDESGQVIDHGERMWVHVKQVVGGWYLGELDNDPYCTDTIKSGLEVWFQPKHVIDIYQEPDNA